MPKMPDLPSDKSVDFNALHDALERGDAPDVAVKIATGEMPAPKPAAKTTPAAKSDD